MADDEEDVEPEDEAQSFRERVEEIRQEQADREEEPASPGMGDLMGGGGGGMGGGNPFAQMMGGMMGGGGGGGELETERVVRELGRVREELRDVNENLDRIATALEDD